MSQLISYFTDFIWLYIELCHLHRHMTNLERKVSFVFSLDNEYKMCADFVTYSSSKKYIINHVVNLLEHHLKSLSSFCQTDTGSLGPDL